MNEYPQNESETFSDLTSATMTSTTFVKPEISKSEVSMAAKTSESVVSMATDLYVSDDCGKQETSDIFSMAASIFYQDNGDPSFSSGFTYEPNYVYLSNVDITVQGHEQQGSQQFCQNESVNSINYQYPGNNSSSDEPSFGGQISQNFISPNSQSDSYSGSYGNDVASSDQSGMFSQGCDSNGISQGQGQNQWTFNPGFVHSYGNGIRSSDMNQQQEFWMQSQQSFSGNMGFGGHGNVHLPFDNGGLNFNANMNQNLPPFSQVQPYGNPFGGNVAGYGIVPGQQAVPAFSENERSFNPSFVPNSSHYPIPPNGGTGKNESKTSSDSPKGSQRSRNSDSDKPYDCTNCGKSFKSEWSLKRHALVHSGEKPYKCNMCDQRYARSDKLRSHLRIHNVTDTKIDIKAFRDTTRTRTSKKARKDLQQIQSVTNIGQNNVPCSDGSAQGGPLPNFSQVFSPPETVTSSSELAITRGCEVQNNNTNSDNCVLPSEESFSIKEEISRKEDDLENSGKMKDMSWHASDSKNEKSVIGIENKTKTEVFLKTNAENPAQGNESSCPSQNKWQTVTVAGTQGEPFLLSSGCDSISAVKMQSNCKPLSTYVPEKNESSCSSNSGGCELSNDENLVHSLANSAREAKRTNKMKKTKEEQDQNFKDKHGTINNTTFAPLERNTNQEVEKSSTMKVETDKHRSSQQHESVIKIIQEVIGKINQESTISFPDDHLESSVLRKGLTLHEINKNSTQFHIENDLGRRDPDGVQNSNELSQNNFNSHRNAINLLGPKKPNNLDAQENVIKQRNEKCVSLCYDRECTSNPHFAMQVLIDQNKYVPEMKMMSQQNKCNLEAGVNPVTQKSVNTLSFGLSLLNPESIGNPDFGLDMLSEHDINNAESELGLTAQQNETDLDSGFGLFNQQGIENANPRYVMLNPEGIDEADSGFSGITQENEIKTIMKTFDLNPAEIKKVHTQYPLSDPNSMCESLGSVKTIDQTQTKGKKSKSSKKRKKDDKKDEEKNNSVIALANNLDDGSVVKDRGEAKMPRKRKAKEAHSCDVCGRLFTQKGSVIRHQLVHSGEKPFECDVCSIKFARIDNLRAHKKTHGIFESWNPNQKEEMVTMNTDKRRSKRHGRSDIKKVISAQIMDLKAQKGKCDEYKTGLQYEKFEVITGENQEVHPDIVAISTAINYEAGHFKDLLVNETKTGNNFKDINLSHRHKELSRQITLCSPTENIFLYQNMVEKGKSYKGSVKNNQVVGHMGNAVKKRKKDAKRKVSVTRNCEKNDRSHLGKKKIQNHRSVKHIQSKEVLRDTRTKRSVTDKNLKKSGNICHCGPNSQSLGLSIIWQKSYICSVCHMSFVNLCSTWNHMFSHTRQDSTKCEICSEKFLSAQKLKCHLLKHISRGKARHKCVYCGFDSQSSRGLRNLRAARKSTSEIKYASQKQKQFVNSMKVAEANCYKCKLCGKQFLWHSYLRFHLLGHEEKLSTFRKTWRREKVKFVHRSQGVKIYQYRGNKFSHKMASKVKCEKKS